MFIPDFTILELFIVVAISFTAITASDLIVNVVDASRLGRSLELTLQPIVENAILHGIARTGRPGRVTKESGEFSFL